jgi:hypothetical protein
VSLLVGGQEFYVSEEPPDANSTEDVADLYAFRMSASCDPVRGPFPPTTPVPFACGILSFLMPLDRFAGVIVVRSLCCSLSVCEPRAIPCKMAPVSTVTLGKSACRARRVRCALRSR